MKRRNHTYQEQITSSDDALAELTRLRDLANEQAQNKHAEGDLTEHRYHQGETQAYNTAIEVLRSLIVNTPEGS